MERGKELSFKLACDQARECLMAHASSFSKANKLTESSSEYVDPCEVVRLGREEAFADDTFWTPVRQAAFWRQVDSDDSAAAFLLVVGAEVALEVRDAAAARSRSRRAMTLLQNDLFIQSLYHQAHRETAASPDTENVFENLFCRAPFQNIETNPNGDVFFCCPAWLPKPIGNLHRSSAGEIWNSQTAQDIRASIHDGSYRHCSRIHCPKLSGGGSGLEQKDQIRHDEMAAHSADRATQLPTMPANIILSHDRSCNIACPSCRRDLILARKEEQADLNAMADDVIFPLLSHARKLRVTASGDPFGSAHFQYVLRNLERSENPELRLDLQTNGLLLTPKIWETLKLEGKVDQLLVSSDAAEAETYAELRRGGVFSTLLKNLEFMARLRAENRIKRLRLDFVVQARNFREMPDFIRLAERFGCDGVKFQMIRSWGTYSVEEFRKHNIGDPSHPDYSDFLKVLREPALSSLTVELWGMSRAQKDAIAQTTF